MPGRWPDSAACTKHASAFRLNKKELAEIDKAGNQEEQQALTQGKSIEEAAALKLAKKRQLTREKQEIRLERSKQRHSSSSNGEKDTVEQEPGADMEDSEPLEPEESQEPVPAATKANAGAASSKKTSSKASTPRRSTTGKPTSSYMLALDEAIQTIQNNRVFKGIQDADPMEICEDEAHRSGVQDCCAICCDHSTIEKHHAMTGCLESSKGFPCSVAYA